EKGVKPARALPYELQAYGTASSGGFTIDFRNSGDVTAVFQVRSALGGALPRCYTVEPAQRIVGAMPTAGGESDVSVHRPNGFFRSFKGGLAGTRANVLVRPTYDIDRDAILLTLTNRGLHRARVRVLDKYTNEHVDQTLEPRESTSRFWSVKAFHNWYDLR